MELGNIVEDENEVVALAREIGKARPEIVLIPASRKVGRERRLVRRVMKRELRRLLIAIAA